MAGGRFYHLLDYLRRAAAPATGAASDAQLLQRFVTVRDETAFAQVAGRHAAMVLGVCRRVLGDAHEAEDAFQATFLILARKAQAAARYRSVGGWLHTVAFRVALRAKNRRASRRGQEMPLEELPAATLDPAAEAAWREVRGVIDQEVGRLPEKYRLPFVLHYFEGLSATEVARELGCPVGTAESWLARARERLRGALSRRKLTVGPAALAVLAAHDSQALARWADWSQRALAAARSAASAVSAANAGEVTAEAALLADQAQRGLRLARWKTAGLLAAAALTAVVAFLAITRLTDDEPTPPLGRPGIAVAPPPAQALILQQAVEKQAGPLRLSPRATAFESRMGQVEALAVSPDARFLAGGGDPFCVKWWDVTSGKELTFLKRLPPAPGKLADHIRNGQQERPLALAFLPDGKTLISAGAKGEVRCWDLEKNCQGPAFVGHRVQLKAMVLRPDGRTLVTAAADSDPDALRRFDPEPPTLLELKVWDATAPGIPPLASFEAVVKKQVWFCAALSADGRTLAWGSDDGLVRLWDVDTGKERVLQDPGNEKGNGLPCVALSPDGKVLATGRYNKQIQLWDTATLRPGAILRGHQGSPRSLLFSGDGRTLFGGTGIYQSQTYAVAGGEFCAWDVASGAATGEPAALDYLVSALVQSDRGGFVVSAGVTPRREGKITVWNVAR